MGKRKNRSDLEAENRFLRRARFNEGFVQIFLQLIRWGGIILVLHQISIITASLAGKITNANIGIGIDFNGLVSNIKITTVLAALIFAILTIIYALAERKLRKDTVERLQKRIIELEQKEDPKRSTSTLTSKGDTRPEDRI